jgi:hypothetical protein
MLAQGSPRVPQTTISAFARQQKPVGAERFTTIIAILQD